jgi:membrane protein required for colicin V production
MIILDVALLLFLAGFVFYGLFFGLIKTLGSLAGVLIGAWAAGKYHLAFYGFAQSLFIGHEGIGKIISFVIVFIIVNRLVGLLFILLDKVFHFLTIIPFLKTINRLAGAVLGLLEGGLVLSLLIFVINKYAMIGGWFNLAVAGSKIVPFLDKFNTVLAPIMPQLMEQLNTVIK